MEGQSPHSPSGPPPLPSSGAASAASGAAGAGAAAGSSSTQKRRRAPSSPFQTLPRPKKHKLPRNLNSITARNLLPDAPTAGTPGPSGNRGGPRTTKGPYKKREKKESVKEGGAKKTPGATASGSTSAAADGAGASLMTGAGGAAGRRGRTGPQAGGRAVGVSDGGSTGPGGLSFADDGDDGRADIADGEQPGQEPGEGGVGATGAAGGEGGEAKDEDDDDHEEEPEYSDDEWNQEASARGRSKDELKALLDCFSDEQLQRYEVYRRSVLSRSTVKKLVATILNQQVTQTMAFVVAGFSKVFVGEMVERAREVMEDWSETGAIRPEHLREAQRRYKKEEVQRGKGVRVPTGYKRRMFCR